MSKKESLKTDYDSNPSIHEFLTVMRTILQKTDIVATGKGYINHDKKREFTISDLKKNGECARISDERINYILNEIFNAGMLTTFTIKDVDGVNYVLQ